MASLLTGIAALLVAPVQAGDIRASVWSATPEVTIGGEANVPGFALGRQEVTAEGGADTAVGAKVEFGSSFTLGVEALSLEAGIQQSETVSVNLFGFPISQVADVDATLETSFVRLRLGWHLGNPEEATIGVLLTAQLTDILLDASATGAGSLELDEQGVMPAAGLTATAQIAPWLRVSGEGLISFWDSEDLIATFIDFSVGLEFHAEPFFAGVQYRSIALEFEELDERFDTELTFTGPQAFAGFTW